MTREELSFPQQSTIVERQFQGYAHHCAVHPRVQLPAASKDNVFPLSGR